VLKNKDQLPPSAKHLELIETLPPEKREAPNPGLVVRTLGFKSRFYVSLRVRSRSLNVAGAVRFRTLDFTKRFSWTLSSTAAAQVLQPAM